MARSIEASLRTACREVYEHFRQPGSDYTRSMTAIYSLLPTSEALAAFAKIRTQYDAFQAQYNRVESRAARLKLMKDHKIGDCHQIALYMAHELLNKSVINEKQHTVFILSAQSSASLGYGTRHTFVAVHLRSVEKFDISMLTSTDTYILNPWSWKEDQFIYGPEFYDKMQTYVVAYTASGYYPEPAVKVPAGITISAQKVEQPVKVPAGITISAQKVEQPSSSGRLATLLWHVFSNVAQAYHQQLTPSL